MEETYKSDYRLIDPRKVEIDNTTTNFYNPALRECGFEIPLYVAIYNQIRYFEDFGKLKIGYCVQSKEAFAEQFGVSVSQVEKAFNHLTSTYKLGNWVICDTKIFRNVKKVWVSNVRQKRGTMDEAIRLLQSLAQQENYHQTVAELPQYGSKTTTVWQQNYHDVVNSTPVLTDTESNIKIKERERDSNSILDSADASGSADASPEPSPFFLSVSNQEKDVSGTANHKKEFALCSDLLALMGLGNVRPGVKLRNSVRARLKEGYSEIDLRAIARWSATQQDEFYKVPHSLFSEAGVASAISLMNKTKKGTTHSTR